MKFTSAPLSGVFIIDLEPRRDERGAFVRTFCQKDLETIGLNTPVVQMNHSVTRRKGAVRGMHYQVPPASEIKMVRCVRGRAFDVVVDIRAGSATFLQWHGVELSEDNWRMVYIPEGFAHGFQTLTDNVELVYNHSSCYSPEHERGLRSDDPALAIRWPLPVVARSDKDKQYPLIAKDFTGIIPGNLQ